MVKTRFAAIPTMYRNVRFRSRLEARWAAWMDMVEWKWEYEPIDFNGYIPDFILYEFPGKPILEIKPFESLTVDDFETHIFPALDKARNAIPDRDLIVFGSRVIGADELCENYWHYPYENDPPAILGIYQSSSDKRGLFRLPCLEMLRGFWKEAGNLVQWKGNE